MAGGPEGSITHWIGPLKAGDPEAIRALWDRFIRRAEALARAKLRKVPARTAEADEEDIALSAFHALCRGAAQGKFDQLEDRDDLWRLLAVLTARKTADQVKRQARLRRGGGAPPPFGQDVDGDDPLENAVADDPPPALAAMLAEEFQRRLDALDDDELRHVALLRLDGHTTDEIAATLGCARRTVARRLDLIRQIWVAEAGGPDEAPG